MCDDCLKFKSNYTLHIWLTKFNLHFPVHHESVVQWQYSCSMYRSSHSRGKMYSSGWSKLEHHCLSPWKYTSIRRLKSLNRTLCIAFLVRWTCLLLTHRKRSGGLARHCHFARYWTEKDWSITGKNHTYVHRQTQGNRNFQHCYLVNI